MAIASVLRGSYIDAAPGPASTPVRDNTELMKREEVDAKQKVTEREVASEKKDERKMEGAKGVKEVDTEA